MMPGTGWTMLSSTCLAEVGKVPNRSPVKMLVAAAIDRTKKRAGRDMIQ
jgi:hypothetical protein